MRLTEITDSTSLSAVQEAANIIRARAQPWLGVSNNGQQKLYRGVQRDYLSYRIVEVRQDRRPKDTTTEWTHVYNTAIAAAGGVASRNNSVFASPVRISASAYGLAHVLIPLDNFNYTWSPFLTDWTLHFHYKQLSEILDKEKISDEIKKEIIKYSKALGSGNIHWFDNISYGGIAEETMLKLTSNMFNVDSTREMIRADKDIDLLFSIDAGREIMIHAKEVMLLNTKFYTLVQKELAQ